MITRALFQYVTVTQRDKAALCNNNVIVKVNNNNQVHNALVLLAQSGPSLDLRLEEYPR